MKKRVYITCISLLAFNKSMAQEGATPTPPVRDSTVQEKQYYRKIESIDTALKKTMLNRAYGQRKLVSNYTFRNLVKNDFALLLTGDKNKTTVGKYAALDLNAAERRFTLTPIAYVPGNDPLKSPFNTVWSLDISGAVSGDKVFNFKDRNTITIGFSYTFVNGIYGFGANRPPDDNYRAVYDLVKTQFQKNYTENNLPPDKDNIERILNYTSLSSDTNKLERAYMEKVKEYEEKLTADKWTSRTFYWFKITGNAISNDNFTFIDPTLATTETAPQTKSVYNPSLQVSGNFYKITRTGLHFYINAYYKFARKHTLSEIHSTRQWNKIKPVNDSIYYSSESRSVFALDQSKFSTMMVKDGGIQIILIKDFSNILDAGIDIKYDNVGFIKPDTKTAISRIETISVGLLFPLKDKDGKSTVNIEPFYQYRQYKEYEKAYENIWGIRFSVPFKNVL